MRKYLAQGHFAALSLLTAFVMVTFLLQTCLRHPDSRSAKGNREGVFKKMREAMATITSVVQDEHKEEMAEKGSLAMDLGEFEVSVFDQTFLQSTCGLQEIIQISDDCLCGIVKTFTIPQ